MTATIRDPWRKDFRKDMLVAPYCLEAVLFLVVFRAARENIVTRSLLLEVVLL